MKSIFLSKTFWGSMITLAGATIPKLGIGSADADKYASFIVEAIGTALTIYGRLKATQPVNLTGK